MEIVDSTIKQRSVKGLKWMTSADLVARLLQLGVSIVLARLLGPTVFGIFGVCLILLKLVGMVGDLGFGVVIIQRETLTEKLINSASVLCVLVSGALTVGCFISADYLYSFFPYGDLPKVLRAFSFVLVLEGFSIILRALFIRELRFPALSVIQLLAIVAGSAISLILAFSGFALWSLIVGLYAETILKVGLFTIFGNHSFRPRIDRVSLKENKGYAFKILQTRAAYFLNMNIGALLVGRFLGADYLGFYVVAYGIMDAPVQRISKNVGIVSFAALSKFQSNILEFAKMYRSILHYYSLVIFALFIGIIVVSREFVVSFYGSAWQDMVVPLRLLCIAGIFRSLLVISSSSFIALNRVETEIGISYGQSMLMVVFVPLMLHYGISGACLGVVGAHAVGYILSLVALSSFFKEGWTKGFSHLYYSAVPSGVMLLTWFAIDIFLRNNLDTVMLLVTNIMICGITFVLTVWLMDRTVFSQIRRFIMTGS